MGEEGLVQSPSFDLSLAAASSPSHQAPGLPEVTREVARGQAGPGQQRERLLDRSKGGASGPFLRRPLGRAPLVLCSSFRFLPALGSAVSFPLSLSALLTEHSAVSEALRFGGGAGKEVPPRANFFFFWGAILDPRISPHIFPGALEQRGLASVMISAGLSLTSFSLVLVSEHLLTENPD